MPVRINKKHAAKFRWLREAHILFTLIALVFGTYFLHAIPLFWGYDETQHFSRAYQISRGEVRAEKLTDDEYGGTLPSNLHNLMRTVERDLQNNTSAPFYARRDISFPEAYGRDASVTISPQTQSVIFPGSAVYSPVAYLPAAIGIRAGTAADLSIGNTVLLARAALLLSYIALVAYGLYLLKKHSAKYIVLVIGLLPMSLAQAAVVSADALANGLGLFLFSAYIYAATSRFVVSKSLYIALAFFVISLPLVKLNYLFVCLPFLLIKPPFSTGKFNIQGLGPRIATLLGLLAPAISWSVTTKDMVGHIVSALPHLKDQVDSKAQITHMLSNPFDFVITLAGTFARYGDEYIYGLTASVGWNYVGLPLLGTVIISILVFMATSQAQETLKNTGRLNLYMLIAGLVAIMGIFVTLYVTFTAVGDNTIQGVQGRYFIPALPFVLYGIARLLPKMQERAPGKSLAFYSSGMVIVLALGSLWYFLSTY